MFFPDSPFKEGIETLQYRPENVFDSLDLENQEDWAQKSIAEPSPLENFLIDLYETYSSNRKILPAVPEFFHKMIG